MSADLENLLRDTMQSRASTVTTGPAWTAPQDQPARRRPKWIAPVAAAAAIAAVAVAIAALPDHKTAPPASSTSPTPAPSPKPTKIAIPASCQATLPAAWKSALTTAQVDLGGISNMPMSSLPDGTVAVAHDAGVQPGDARSVLLVRPGHATQTAYTVADPDTFEVAGAYLSGHWLVVVESRAPRPPKNTVPGSSPMPNVHRLVVVDRATGQQTVVARMRDDGSGPYIDSATVMDGRVYWDVRAKYGAGEATIYSYGLATGDRRTEYQGNAGYLLMSTVSIHDQEGRVLARRALPPVVARAVGSAVARVTTDGTNWAWARDEQTVGWWTPGLAAPKYLKVPNTFVDFDGGGGGGISVSGHYVFGAPITPMVADMQTGAVAPTTGKTIYGGHAYGQFGLAPSNGLVAGVADTHDARYVGGYWQDGETYFLRVDLAHLPEIGC